MAKKYNTKIDIIIPAYNVEDHILFRCLASISCQNNVEDLEVTIVDDASTVQNYEKIANNFKSILKINILRYEENKGPGVARQYGIDHTQNGYITFIDADDTFNGAFALSVLKEGLESNGNLFHTCIGVFDEILETENDRIIMAHEYDQIWMFGKMYRRSFIDKYNIRFHPTSRANEDNGFNTIVRLCSNESEQINFISEHVYYWHENLKSITRKNDCQYTYGSSQQDSFYGYVENMIYAIQESKKRNPYNGDIVLWTVNCLMNMYEYYIECAARAPEHAPLNLSYCKLFYNQVYKNIEEDISNEALAYSYNSTMANSYINNKLEGIIPHIGFFEFLEELKK